MLVVEDDGDVAVPLAKFFLSRGFDASVEGSGQGALTHVADVPTDLLVLDLVLPDLDGVDVCGTLRDRGFDGGIIMLSGRSQEVDVVTGLDAGADDYLAKPCSVAELEARVYSVLRRVTRTYVVAAGDRHGHQVSRGGHGLEVHDHRITHDGVQVVTSGREHDVLALLIARQGQVVTIGDLMDGVWGPDWSGSSVVLSSAVGRIRKRMVSAGVSERVEAVHGVGFRLTHPGRP